MRRHERPGPRSGDSASYPLRAWVEGHYARDCGMTHDANPYRNDEAMAHAWDDGWHCREHMTRRPSDRAH